jgi:hypothetical protein
MEQVEPKMPILLLRDAGATPDSENQKAEESLKHNIYYIGRPDRFS